MAPPRWCMQPRFPGAKSTKQLRTLHSAGPAAAAAVYGGARRLRPCQTCGWAFRLLTAQPCNAAVEHVWAAARHICMTLAAVKLQPQPPHLAPLPQFYARGLFAAPAVTSWRGTVEPSTLADQLRSYLWGAITVVHSLLDWPVRNLSGEAGCGGCAARASPAALHMLEAWSKWQHAADACRASVPTLPSPQAAGWQPRRALCLLRRLPTMPRWRPSCGTCQPTSASCRGSPGWCRAAREPAAHSDNLTSLPAFSELAPNETLLQAPRQNAAVRTWWRLRPDVTSITLLFFPGARCVSH